MTDGTPEPALEHSALDRLCAKTLRALATDGVQQATNGPPGLPSGLTDAAYILWTRFLKHNPEDPHWPDRDRLVFSSRQSSLLLYALLHLSGYELSRDDLRQSQGKPPSIAANVGPLEQSLGVAVGMALAERWLATRFNRPGFLLVDHATYALCGEADLIEGLSHEAASIAGHLALGKLIVLYEAKQLARSDADDVALRFTAYGWQVLEADGHAMTELAHALAAAKDEPGRPSLVIARTRSSRPPAPAFVVKEEVYEHMQLAVEVGNTRQREWDMLLERYKAGHPELGALWEQMQTKALPTDWSSALPHVTLDGQASGTHGASNIILNALTPHIPSLLGGSAELKSAHNTLTGENFSGRNLHFGVRVQAMGAALNGLALHGGLLPYGSSSLSLSDAMRQAMRMAALMGLQVVYLFSDDSSGLDPDGPLHQPLELALRLIPNLHVVRPDDANAVALAWRAALERRNGPTAIILSRQPVRARAPGSALWQATQPLTDLQRP